MAGLISAGSIVLEVLNQANYEQWKIRVKTYLLAEDLWETVESDPPSQPLITDEKFKISRRKNARALHAIHISCGNDIFPFIKDKTAAKDAWGALEEHFSGDLPVLYLSKKFEDSTDRGLHIRLCTAKADKRGIRTSQSLKSEGSEESNQPSSQGFESFLSAVEKGDLQMVKCLVKKNKEIVTQRFPPQKWTPVLHAYATRNWEIASYLYSATPVESLTRDFDGCDGAELISQSFFHKKFDIAWDLIQREPTLALTKGYFGHSPFNALAGVKSAFLSGERLEFWEQWIYDCICIQPTPTTNDISVNIVEKEEDHDQGNQKDLIRSVKGSFQGLAKNLLKLLGINRIYKMKLAHVRTQEFLRYMCEVLKNEAPIDPMQASFLYKSIFRAVERGHVEFITHICKEKPDMIMIIDDEGRTIFHYAIECRQEKIYNLIHTRIDENQRNIFVNAVDKFNNGMLHAAANLSARLNLIQGAALQMQRELQWFKEVGKCVPPVAHEMINSTDRMTAHELFAKNHKELMTEGETSMKATATSCTVVGALIVTMMFAAAFTVPGGNGDTGFPMFLGKKLFMVFIIADSVSLFSSTTSVMIFLGILTSRYAEEDFLKSLPTKMILGLFTLFFSIASMMIAFSSALVLMLDNESWIVIPVILLASVPITSFVWMQFPLLIDLYVSTYRVRLFEKKKSSNNKF